MNLITTNTDSQSSRLAFVCLAIFVIFTPGLVLASDCFRPSLSVTRNIDVYEALQPTRLTSEQYLQLQVLFKKMKGKWKGTSRAIICKGSKEEVQEEVVSYDTDVEIEHADTSVKIESHMHSSEQKTNVDETLSLFISPNRLGLTEVSRVGDLEVVSVSEQFLVFYRKYVRRTQAGGAVAKEVVRSVAVYPRQLMMERVEYTNGLLSEKIVWELKFKR